MLPLVLTKLWDGTRKPIAKKEFVENRSKLSLVTRNSETKQNELSTKAEEKRGKTRTFVCLAVFFLALALWSHYDISTPDEPGYSTKSYLFNSTSGEMRAPRDVVDLNKILNQTEEYRTSTNAVERLFDLIQQTNYENLFAIQQEYQNERHAELAAGPMVDERKCAREVDWILRELNTRSHPALIPGEPGRELTKFIDSFGRPGAELFSGVPNWPGAYEQCLSTSLNSGEIKTRYCTARMSLKGWPTDREFGLPRTRVNIGICLPETCDTRSFAMQRQKIESLIKRDMGEFLRTNLRLESMFCLPDERSPLRRVPTGGWILIGSTSCWLALVLAASLSVRTRVGEQNNTITNQSIVGKMVWALSLQSTWRAFTHSHDVRKRAGRDEQPRVELNFFDCVKYFMALLIIGGHSFLLIEVYSSSLAYRISFNLSPLFYLGANLHKMVDVFFLISGALATYTLLRKCPPARLASPLTWLLFNLKLLLRLSPIYLLVFYYNWTLAPLVGDGPWWDYGISLNTMRGACQLVHWRASILYLSNISQIPCVGTSWFLISLAKISLLVPLLTYLLYKLPGHSKKILLLACIALLSALTVIVKMKRQTSFKGEAFGTHGAFLMLLMRRFEDLGLVSPLGQISCVAIGCYMGYLLHQFEVGAIREWPAWLRSRKIVNLAVLGHLLILAIPSLSSIALRGSKQQTSVDQFLAMHVTLMVVWPTLNVILMLNYATTLRDSHLVRWMNRPFWRRANKLGLSLYLVHWELIEYMLTAHERGPPVASYGEFVKLFAAVLVLSHLLAFVTTILIELPFAGLISCVTSTASDTLRDVKESTEQSEVKPERNGEIFFATNGNRGRGKE